VEREQSSEKALIEAACQGDEEAFLAIFDAHQTSLYRFAIRLGGTGGEAEEIVQDVFLSLIRRPDGFDPDRGTLRQYLLGVVRHQTWKRLRRPRAAAWVGLPEVADPAGTPESYARRGEIRDRVAAAIRRLPPLQREVIVLAHFEQIPLADIAAMLEIESGAVKSRLQRARAALRVMLEPLQAEKLTE
jgi:RNA polymerase sigma-70 factor, ECF subfamily